MTQAADKPTSAFKYAAPDEAIAALLEELSPVGTESLSLADAAGRVLAEQIVADRDSPPCNVSAMDGYAVRLTDLSQSSLPVAGEAVIGQPPPKLPAGKTMRIFTGGPVPDGADAVIRREDVDEQPETIALRIDANAIEPGQNVRRTGENLQAGHVVVEPGVLIDASVMSAAASFGAARINVYRRARVGIIVTGDELHDVASHPQPWQLRDSNGPTLMAMLSAAPWLTLNPAQRVADDAQALSEVLGQALADCDAVILTGGVSMGDHDHVPQVVADAGAQIVFHKLPIRPGKPLLGAVGPAGQAVVGLPGNPVSVMVTGRRFAAAALRKRAGCDRPELPPAQAAVRESDDKTLSLYWYRLVRCVEPGAVELVANRGSGDLVAAARSDGFVEIPPREHGAGPWPYYPWSL